MIWPLALVLLLASSSMAEASGLSAANVGTARSGPVTIDAASVYWNPSLLGYLPQTELLLGAIVNVGSISYQRERMGLYQYEDSFDFSLPIAPEAIDLSKTGQNSEVSATPVGAAPSLFAGIRLGDGSWVLGFGVYAPYAAMLAFDAQGPQRWALTEATIVTIYATPSVGWRITDWISVGVGISYVAGLAEFARVQDFATVQTMGDALGRPPLNQANDFGQNAPTGVRELEVMSRDIAIMQALAHGITFNAGVTVTPVDTLRLGLSYQHSVALDFIGDFALDMDDDFFTQDLANQGLQFVPLVEGEASLSFTLPRSILFGAAVALGQQFELAGTFGYTFWSQLDAFDVRLDSPDLAQPEIGLPRTQSVELPRNWQNTVAVELMLQYYPLQVVSFWLSGGYQSAASPDSTVDVASVDGARLIGNLGAVVSVNETIGLVGDFEIQGILPRTVVSSDNDQGNGTYNLMLFVVGLHLQISL